MATTPNPEAAVTSEDKAVAATEADDRWLGAKRQIQATGLVRPLQTQKDE